MSGVVALFNTIGQVTTESGTRYGVGVCVYNTRRNVRLLRVVVACAPTLPYANGVAWCCMVVCVSETASSASAIRAAIQMAGSIENGPVSTQNVRL